MTGTDGRTAISVNALVADFGQSMYRVALSIVGDRMLAEDVVQEALLRAWQNMDSYRGEASLRNWVLRITHNCAISATRRRRDEVRAPESMPERNGSADFDTERTVAGRAAVAGLWGALAELDPTSRAIVVLREIDRLTYEEIAEVLGVALPTVKTKLFRARRTLSLRLKEWR